ncbi:MAG: YggS family pyridoxal phosphate-dependent enzyme [Aestuariivirga sp.]
MSDAVLRWREIQGKVAGRAQLVAVSKTFNAGEIEPLIAAGQRLFGENRVQEAASKWPALRRLYPSLELHLIGPLQSNKAAEAVALFDVIQTVDRAKIAEALAKEMKKQGRVQRCFVQVNIGREPQKAGLDPEGLDEFLILCRKGYGLNVVGLMCIPPADMDPKPYFKSMAQMAARSGLKELSMGMSSDFEEAIGEGATYVRVGSAIFGGR